MVSAVQCTNPDMIICPYLITKIPSEIFCKRTRPSLIVHPGVAGDKGVSSLDFAIRNKEATWGVTVLQAEENYDAGAVWSTEEFQMPEDITKTTLYNGVVSDVAVKCTVDAVSRFSQGFAPEPVNHEMAITSMKRMKKSDRNIDWRMPACSISAHVRMSDTRPGAIADVRMNDTVSRFRLFNAHVENGSTSEVIRQLLSSSAPGDLLAQRNGFVLFRGGDGQGVWIGQMKKDIKEPSLKLPAVTALQGYDSYNDLRLIKETCSCDDILIRREGPVCYVHFAFYNGAMSTNQATRLREAIDYVKTQNDIQIVALMGGEMFFSTGINLTIIENNTSKHGEAWANINGINDVIKSVVTMTDKVSVAVLKGNAAAGGAMFAAACDIVVSHPGVLLAPSYKSMSLYGSEYWTYFFPRRVGRNTAERLIDDITPLSADSAKSVGLIDDIIGEDRVSFNEELPEFLKRLLIDGRAGKIVREKQMSRDSDWIREIQKHRDNELKKMAVNFRSETFLSAMHSFLYKKTG